MRAKRFFVYCYDVTPDFVEKFKYPKKDGKDEFLVNYMEAAFDQEAKRGEFFVDPLSRAMRAVSRDHSF